MREKWNEIRGDGQTYGQRTIEKALEGFASSKPEPTVYKLRDLELVPKSGRPTPTKLIVPFEVRVAGKPVGLTQVTTVPSSCKAVAKDLLHHIPGATPETETELRILIGRMLLEAGTMREAELARPNGRTIYDILAEYVPTQTDFLYQMENGHLVSSKFGDMSRQSFVERFTNHSVLELVATASDAPRDDCGIQRASLATAVERELKLLWGELLKLLPKLEDADIPIDSEVAVDFRRAVAAIWTKMTNMELVRKKTPSPDGDSVQLAVRTSLIGLTRRYLTDPVTQTGWIRLQPGLLAWMRLVPPAEGNGTQIHLAMHWDLAEQMHVRFPKVGSQDALQRIAVRFGAIDPNPQLSATPDRGNSRFVVLSRRLVDELLAVPEESAETRQQLNHVQTSSEEPE